MKSLLSALLVATALAPLPGLADDNPVRRCDKNHHILRQIGCIPEPAQWEETQKLVFSHGTHTATLLADGRVLVTGYTSIPEVNAETYDPAAAAWTLTSPMTRDRAGHTATRLADGRVLVVGGEMPRYGGDWFPFEGSAEIFDPAANAWASTGSLATKRGGFTATLLPTGEVLVVGGYSSDDDSLASAELFDPATGQWKPAASMQVARFWHTATSLPDGNVLVVGGWYDDWLQLQVREAEMYDWRSGRWLSAGEITGRGAHSATLLDDGRVLVVGGYTSSFPPGGGWRSFWTLDTAVVFDGTTSQWSDAGNIGIPRFGHLAAALRGGGALLVGGTETYNFVPDLRYRAVPDAMSYSPADSTWLDLGPPPIALAATSVTRLDDGTLLFVGANRAVLYKY
jgi:N-acetylneuraminic acid mutarotase